MNLHRLKESVEAIEMTEEMKARLLRTCKAADAIDENPAPRRFVPKRALGVVCAACLIAAVGGIAVWRGGIRTTPQTAIENGHTVSQNHGGSDSAAPGVSGGEKSD